MKQKHKYSHGGKSYLYDSTGGGGGVGVKLLRTLETVPRGYGVGARTRKCECDLILLLEEEDGMLKVKVTYNSQNVTTLQIVFKPSRNYTKNFRTT